MLTRILAASAVTVGLATTVMAQNTGGTSNGGTAGSGQSIIVDPTTPAQPPPDQIWPDTGTTGSTTDMNSNADTNCPATPQGAQGDANNTAAGTVSPTVNDQNCGK